jgi:hypothetical protein
MEDKCFLVLRRKTGFSKGKTDPYTDLRVIDLY